MAEPLFRPGSLIGAPATHGKARFWWGAVALYAAAIFALSSQSRPLGDHELPAGADKAGHAALFGGWSLAVFKALRASWPAMGATRAAGMAVVLTVVHGATDEVHQMFVPERQADGFDLLADAVGALVVQLAVLRMVRS